jgi:hypothetical protein
LKQGKSKANKAIHQSAVDELHDIIVTTYSLKKESLNVTYLDTLLLASPIKSEIAVTQVVGRLRPSRSAKVIRQPLLIADIIDSFGYFISQWRARREIYVRKEFSFAEAHIESKTKTLLQSIPLAPRGQNKKTSTSGKRKRGHEKEDGQSKLEFVNLNDIVVDDPISAKRHRID